MRLMIRLEIDMSVLKRQCAAYYKGGWQTGLIIKHDVKNGFCLIETKKYGTIKVVVYLIRMTDKDE